MSTDVALFILRVLSATLLLVLLVAIFMLILRDYQSTVGSKTRTVRYGRLVGLQMIDGTYVVVGEVYPLLPLTRLGRSPTNNVVIKDNFASSEHAQVVLRDGQWWLEDRHSRNGTTLNEIPINQPVVMTTGDIIGIGNKRYRLELER
ncbi:MAG: hypothetical protein OHK0046_04390 [Anaerolineae bacterium]